MDTISRGPSVQTYLSSNALTFAIVPDNSRPDAYHETVRDCSYIIHVASPLAMVPGDLVSQAVAGTKAILEAAKATSTVKRVIFTASTSSIRPFERFLVTHPDNQAMLSGRGKEVSTMTADSRVPTISPDSDNDPSAKRYIDSKIAAVKVTDEFETAHFSIINIMPGWILGPEELARTKQEAFKGSNMILSWLFSELSLAPLVGIPADQHVPLLAEVVHLDDVVESHVKALDTDRLPGKYRNFLLCSDGPIGPDLMSAADIVRRELPQEVADGKISFAGRLGRSTVQISRSKG